jgi:hypothetical protein
MRFGDNFDESERLIIEKTYGYTYSTINCTFHCMPLIEMMINGNLVYVAIETNIDRPYKLQFCYAKSLAELINLVQIRYNYEKVKTFPATENDLFKMMKSF